MTQSDQSPRLGWALPCVTPCLAAGILLGRMASGPFWALAALLCAFAAAFITRGRLRRIAVCMIFLAFGAARGYFAFHPMLPDPGEHTITGVVSEDIHRREDGQVRTVLRHVSVDGVRVCGGAYWTCYPQEDQPLPDAIQPGTRIQLQASVYHPQGQMNPGGFHFKDYLLQRDVRFGVYGMEELVALDVPPTLAGWSARVRFMLTSALVDVMGEDAGRYASTMLLGSRSLIPEEERTAFNRLGIAHILSVSGFHVGVLAGLLTGLLALLHVYRGWRVLCTGLILALYAMLTGLNPPVIRASVLVVLFQIGRWQNRQNHSAHLLLVSALIQLLYAPTQLISASFQLSYGAMAGLVLIFPSLQHLWTPENKKLKKLWRMVSASLAAQLGVLLPTLYWFHELPVLGVVFNVLVLSWSTLLLAALWVVLALLPIPWLASMAGAVVGGLTELVLHLIHTIGSLPWLSVRTGEVTALTVAGILCLMVGASYLWPFRRRLLLAAGPLLLALSLIRPPYPHVSYIQFSVGNADAALIRSHDMTIAVDTGDTGSALADYLTHYGLNLDALILTHLHADHAGGVQALLDARISVDHIYLPAGAQDAVIDESMPALLTALADAGAVLHTLSRGDVLPLPDGSLTVLWPEDGKVRAGLDANLHSLTALLSLRGSSLLLTGDLDGAYEAYAAVPADLLKAAHHGSRNSSLPAFLDTVAPQAVLLSCNSEAQRQRLQERCGDLPVYSTHADGAILIDFEENEFTIQTIQ